MKDIKYKVKIFFYLMFIDGKGVLDRYKFWINVLVLMLIMI